MIIEAGLNLSELNLDGSHAIAKKGGEAIAYQGRKKAKTTNIAIRDGDGFIIAMTRLMAGNPNDVYQLKSHLQAAFKAMKRLGLVIQGAVFNAEV